MRPASFTQESVCIVRGSCGFQMRSYGLKVHRNRFNTITLFKVERHALLNEFCVKQY